MSARLQLVLFLFEYFAWQLDLGIFTTHKHQLEIFGRNLFCLLVVINSWPHLAAAFVYHNQKKWWMLLYLPYLLLFTIGQIYTWWLPYFFKMGLWHSDKDGMKLEQYKKYHSNYHRILPQYRDHPIIPDTEHTILFILTSLTLISSIRCVFSRFFLSKPSTEKEKYQ